MAVVMCNKIIKKVAMKIFKNYRDAVIIKDHVKCRHIIAGDHSYYNGYYHGKPFDDCVMYLDELDNGLNPEGLDKLIIGKFCSIATGAKFMLGGTQGHNYKWISVHPLDEFDDTFFQLINGKEIRLLVMMYGLEQSL